MGGELGGILGGGRESTVAGTLCVVASLLTTLVARPATAQLELRVEVASGFGEVRCSLSFLDTVTDSFSFALVDTSVECLNDRPGASTESLASVVIDPALVEPSIVDATIDLSRSDLGPASVDARSAARLEYSVSFRPLCEGQLPPPLFPVDAEVGYTLATLNSGEIGGGGSATLEVGQIFDNSMSATEDRALSTRVDGVAERGTLEVTWNAFPGYLVQILFEARCGAASQGFGAVGVECQAQAGNDFAFGFNQQRLDDLLGPETFPLDECYEIVFVPEPVRSSALAACLLSLAALRSLAARHARR